MYSAVTGAIGALSGPSHGGANRPVMEMLAKVGEPENAEGCVRDTLRRGERIMGFGHRVYRVVDPRAKILKGMTRNLCERTGNTKWFEISEIIEDIMIREKNIFPNPQRGRLLGQPLPRVRHRHRPLPRHLRYEPRVRLDAHVLEQQADNRLIRPRAEYTGLRDVSYAPLEGRSYSSLR